MSQAAHKREAAVVKALQEATKAFHRYLDLKWKAQDAVNAMKRGDFVTDGQGGRITQGDDIHHLFVEA